METPTEVLTAASITLNKNDCIVKDRSSPRYQPQSLTQQRERGEKKPPPCASGINPPFIPAPSNPAPPPHFFI